MYLLHVHYEDRFVALGAKGSGLADLMKTIVVETALPRVSFVKLRAEIRGILS